MHFAQAIVRAGGATAAIAGHAEVAAQIFQRAGAALGGFANLPVGDSFADADVHERSPLANVMRIVIIVFKCE